MADEKCEDKLSQDNKTWDVSKQYHLKAPISRNIIHSVSYAAVVHSHLALSAYGNIAQKVVDTDPATVHWFLAGTTEFLNLDF